MIVNACYGEPICLGYETENDVEAVVFDKSAWIAAYGPGTFELVHKRRQDSEALPVAVDVSGGVVTWTITAADVAYRGAGEAQLRYYNAAGQIKASEIYRTQVSRSLVSDPDVPSPLEGWVEQVLAAAAGIQNMQAEAETLVPGSAATVTKTVDPDTGVVTLTFGIPEGLKGNTGRGIASMSVLSTGEWRVVYTDGTSEIVGYDVYAALNILVSAAQTAASQAAGSASGASSSASASAQAAQAAQTAAESAASSAENAKHDADRAEQYAENAQASATAAAGSASAAAGSASSAASANTAAQQAKTDAEDARDRAETAAQTLKYDNNITDTIVWSANKGIVAQKNLSTVGNAVDSALFKCSDYIDIGDANSITITVPVYTSSSGARGSFGLVFYDENKSYQSSGYQLELGTNSNKNIDVDVPTTAIYFRTTYFNDDYTSYVETVDFECVLHGTLKMAVDELQTEVNELQTEIDGLKAQNYTILGQEEINEFFGLKESGTFPATIFGITSYINCKDVQSLAVKMAVLSSSIVNTIGIAFYDDEKTQLSFVPCNRGAENSAEIRNISVPDGAYYFRCSYWNFENSALYGGDWLCSFIAPYKKRPYQSGYTFFSPKVNQSVNRYWETALETELNESYLPTTGVLLLPESYTPTGKPTPVIMYFHGISHYVYYDHWGNTDGFRAQKAQFAAAGFAIIDCNGARNNNKVGNFTSGGSLQYSDAYHKCFEYVKEHYNVEEYCHVICASAGGIPGINYCRWFNDAKSLLMLSSWTDLKVNSFDNGVRDTMVEYLGFNNANVYEPEKALGFDPAKQIITIGDTEYLPGLKVPAKAMIGGEESESHIYGTLTRFVTALRNAGQTASLRVVDGATHTMICSSDNAALNTEYINWCKSVG